MKVIEFLKLLQKGEYKKINSSFQIRTDRKIRQNHKFITVGLQVFCPHPMLLVFNQFCAVAGNLQSGPAWCEDSQSLPTSDND